MDNTIIQIDLDIIKYLNDKTCDEIIKLLTSKNLLGKGFWGSVYKFEIKGHKVSVKIQPLENDKMYDSSVEDKRNIELEIDLLKQISQYKIKNSFGHFPYFYFSKTCSNESLMFYEYYSYNLKQFFYKEYNFNDFKNIVGQILISIYFFQQVTGYYHNDIHVENFLVNKLDQPLEQTYTFETINLTKTFIFNKFLISIWDFANSTKIDTSDSINSDTSDSTNSDLEQFKVMFHNFSKKIIDAQLDYDRLYRFCSDKDKFKKYYLSELQKNKIKWKKVSNTDIRSNKIEKSVKKAMIYWIIENNYLDQLIEFYELNKRIPQIYLPTNEMLTWIQNLPNNFNNIFSNY